MVTDPWTAMDSSALPKTYRWVTHFCHDSPNLLHISQCATRPQSHFSLLPSLCNQSWWLLHVLLCFLPQNYKRKTEAAKKEYLKALAAYRASLVSKVTAGGSRLWYTWVSGDIRDDKLDREFLSRFIQAKGCICYTKGVCALRRTVEIRPWTHLICNLGRHEKELNVCLCGLHTCMHTCRQHLSLSVSVWNVCCCWQQDDIEERWHGLLIFITWHISRSHIQDFLLIIADTQLLHSSFCSMHPTYGWRGIFKLVGGLLFNSLSLHCFQFQTALAYTQAPPPPPSSSSHPPLPAPHFRLSRTHGPKTSTLIKAWIVNSSASSLWHTFS